MSRAIYDKAIYHREQQMDRKVYDRARNVLPVEPPVPPVPPVEEYWTVTGMEVTAPGIGYDYDEVFAIQGEPADSHVVDGDACTATITDITPALDEWVVDSVNIEEGGTGYQVDETIQILSSWEEVGSPCIITIDAVDDNGSVTSLSITDSGLFDQDISGEISTYEYSGSGSGLQFSVTAYQNDPGGGIMTVSISNGGTYSADISGSYPVVTDNGSDGIVNITASIKSEE